MIWLTLPVYVFPVCACAQCWTLYTGSFAKSSASCAPSSAIITLVNRVIDESVSRTNRTRASSTSAAQSILLSRLSSSSLRYIVQVHRASRQSLLRLNAELRSISAQDDFARWARLRRKIDRAQLEVSALNTHITTRKATLFAVVNVFITVGSRLIPFLWQTYHSAAGVIALPYRYVLPTFVLWILAFPRAPMGYLNIYLWYFFCSYAIHSLDHLYTFVNLKLQTSPIPQCNIPYTNIANSSEKVVEKLD